MVYRSSYQRHTHFKKKILKSCNGLGVLRKTTPPSLKKNGYVHDAKNEYSVAEDLSRNQQKEQSSQYKGGAEMGGGGGRPGVSTGMQELK